MPIAVLIDMAYDCGCSCMLISGFVLAAGYLGKVKTVAQMLAIILVSIE